MVGNENTRKAKITRVSQHRMSDYKKCALSFFLKLVVVQSSIRNAPSWPGSGVISK